MKILFKHSEIIHGDEYIKCFIGLPDENTEREWNKIKRIVDLEFKDKQFDRNVEP